MRAMPYLVLPIWADVYGSCLEAAAAAAAAAAAGRREGGGLVDGNDWRMRSLY